MDNKNSPKNILIVGMPRSGTSMTTNIFVRQGYYVAEDLKSQTRQGDKDNPAGYFEAEQLIEANVSVFNAAGYPHHNTWLFDAIDVETANSIDNVRPEESHRALVDSYNQHNPWVWKDPRLCYTLGYWWNILDKDSTAVLLLRRNPMDIYQSFLRMNWRKGSEEDKQDVLEREIAHITAAKKTIEALDIPYVEIDYGKFESNPKEIIGKLNSTFNLNLKVTDLGYDKKLNHKGFKGKIGVYLRRLKSFLFPHWLRSFIKVMLPKFLLEKLKKN
ncbi:hypothetical protein FLL45_06470 [Aliikangiella marina]|uniref:Sulfotransferase family protein n=1 Tax=Aliikangiella marina TaxID=1712262 RepID=A0A545TBM9_9GAMM|nr:sulfotransferase [Aliikangiella marina]TQV74604.1 hypothetical protein FLL45_06470 [Aliikangiella marina]